MQLVSRAQRWVKESLIPKLGLEGDREGRAEAKAMAHALHAILHRYDIRTVVEAGSGYGEFRDFLRRRVKFTGHIFSFEPDDRFSQHLYKRSWSEDPKWTLVPQAVGAEEGQDTLYQMFERRYNSFRRPFDPLPQDVRLLNRIVASREVTVTTLDAHRASFLDPHHVVLRIDAPGYELEVAKGAEALLSTVPAVMVTVPSPTLYHDAPAMSEVLRAFSGYGFGLAEMIPATSNGMIREYEFDCLLTRKPVAS